MSTSDCDGEPVFRITHIKARCKLPAFINVQSFLRLHRPETPVRVTGGIIVVRRAGYTYIIFSQNVCNICGIRELHSAWESIYELAALFAADVRAIADTVVVDNVSGTGVAPVPSGFDCENYARSVHPAECARISFDRQRICAVQMAFVGGGTCMLFSSGKYNILGCPSSAQIWKICKIVHDSFKTQPQDTPNTNGIRRDNNNCPLPPQTNSSGVGPAGGLRDMPKLWSGD